MAHDVFISYSNKDKSAADTVCSILENNSIRCWIAPRDITPGTPFAEGIIDGIKGSSVFVLIYSDNTNHSTQVIKEVDRAVHHGIAIIPLRLENVPMSKQLEYYVSDVHWLDALTPPLEKHINRLAEVVKLLLKMDKVDDNEIGAILGEGAFKKEKPGRQTARPNRKMIIIPLLIALIAITISSILLFNHRTRVKWAREEAIPEIQRLIEANDVWRNLVGPYRLAEKTEKVLGKDPELQSLFSQISLNIDVTTEPPGAGVYIREYGDKSGEWTFLGITPLKSIRVPVGVFRWMLTKEGYDTVLAASSTWGPGSKEGSPGVLPCHFIRTLDKAGSTPAGMVRVAATETSVGTIGDFFIGRKEVTNREYKEFVDAGGYQQQKYWKHSFESDGKKPAWAEAMKKFVDQSVQTGPAGWIGGDYPLGEANYPVSGVSWYEAAAYAEFKEMTLPTTYHWNIARGGFTPMVRVFQLGGFAIFAPFSNFSQKGPVEAGKLSGITAYGAYDMAGNVREWCWNETSAGRVIRGGSWQDNTYEFGNLRQAPAMDRSLRNGIRLAFYPQHDSIPEEAFLPFTLPSSQELFKIKPVSEEIFRIYREQFTYDPTELNSKIEYSEKSPGGWTREKVSFDAAYGGERVQAFLFLPSNTSPPYQTVIYFPGSAALRMQSSDNIENYYEFTMFLSFLVRNGRALIFPIYKGTFERSKPELAEIHGGNNTVAYTEFLVQLIKDFRRSIDYLETRQDIDTGRIAYYGMSWGGYLGAIIPAVEERLSASVLVAGGSARNMPRPEVNTINYVTRVRIPTLMLNGRYDINIDDRIKPVFELLGTPDEHKRLILYETDHIPPRVEYIKETLAWLDKYLGPVR